jgi:hypothetical protein
MTRQGYEWLEREYPGLTIVEGEVSGHIEFTGAYNEQSGRFIPIRQEKSQQEQGVVLSGSFEILIRGSIDPSTQELPSLYVQGVDHIPDRHFNQTDSAACVCSPLETDEFLTPRFDLRRFLEELVIPFLYGQLFFDKYRRWPWPDYAHGATGLLESYFRNDSDKTVECLQALSQDSSWSKIKAALMKDKKLKGHMPCFCTRADHIRRCHPDAWRGLRKLHHDVKFARINVL